MTAYLLALIKDSRLTAQHVSLLVAIVTNHLVARGSFEAHRLTLMKQAKIRRKDTYIALVHDLHEFDYILYEPGHRYKPTKITAMIPIFATDDFVILPVSETHAGIIVPTFATDDPDIVPVFETHNAGISRKIETDTGVIIPAFETDENSIIPVFEAEGKNVCSDNQTFTAIIPKNETDGPARQPPSSTSREKVSKYVNNDVDDGGGADRGRRSTPGKTSSGRPPARSIDTADVLFAETDLYELTRFKAAFADDPKFANVDLEHYHEALIDWRDRHTGQPPRRTNWMGTARTFIRNDKAAGKLVTLSHDSLQSSASRSLQPVLVTLADQYIVKIKSVLYNRPKSRNAR